MESEKIRDASSILAQIERLSQSVTANPIVEKARESYRQAAAVLAGISSPKSLRPVFEVGSGPGDPDALLVDDLVPSFGARLGGRFVLKHDVRVHVLRELGVDGIKTALQANPQEREGLIQSAFERYVEGSAKPLEEQTREELEATLQALTWLEGIIPNLPDRETVRRQLAWREFMHVFETLAGDDVFRGRKSELDRLRSYVGVLPPASLLQLLKSLALKWAEPAAQPALSVSGPGGIGKSALIARFVLEHSRLPVEARIPFAYLDLDRPALDVGEPLTLIDEMLRQLTLQFGEAFQFAQMRDLIPSQPGDTATPTQRAAIAKARSILSSLLSSLKATIGPRPYLMVLDTFERVQYRGETTAVPFWDLLREMQQQWPFLRVVVSGRAPVSTLILADKPPNAMEVTELDEESANACLRAQGVSSQKIAEAIVRQVGRVPLSLKLAAAVLKEKTDSDLKLEGSKFWIRAADEVIQGQLYDRILAGVDDEEIKRVANPGLVLRRITPELILNVLREPCKLAVKTLDDARTLFERLKKLASLVSEDDSEGSLVHRRELRAVMLKLIQQKQPAIAASVSRSAVDWYSKQRGNRARAEEAYHRLLLRERVSSDLVSDPEVRASLQVSIAELPVEAQRQLATFGLTVDKTVLKKATDEERDLAVASQIEELLPHTSTRRQALRILEDTGTRKNDTPLWRSRTRVDFELQNDDEALKAVETGLQYALEASNSDRVQQLLREKAWICEQLCMSDTLKQTLQTLEDYAARHNDMLGSIQHCLQSKRMEGEFEKQTLDPQLAARAIRLFRQIGSRKFFGLFPATRGFWNAAVSGGSFDWDTVADLIIDSDSPFAGVAFEEELPHARLQETLSAAYARDDHRQLAQALEALATAWPYRNLEVWPPESRRSFMTA